MFSLQELAAQLGLEFSGLGARPVTGLASLSTAGPEQLSFLSAGKHLPLLVDTAAAAVILSAEFSGHCPVDYLVAEDPHLAFARATALFDKQAIT